MWKIVLSGLAIILLVCNFIPIAKISVQSLPSGFFPWGTYFSFPHYLFTFSYELLQNMEKGSLLYSDRYIFKSSNLLWRWRKLFDFFFTFDIVTTIIIFLSSIVCMKMPTIMEKSFSFFRRFLFLCDYYIVSRFVPQTSRSFSENAS